MFPNTLLPKTLVVVALPRLETLAKRFWVKKELVVVALVPVAFTKLRAEKLALVPKRFEEKKLVVVALVVVELTEVKFCSVVELVTSNSPPILANKTFGSK